MWVCVCKCVHVSKLCQGITRVTVSDDIMSGKKWSTPLIMTHYYPAVQY